MNAVTDRYILDDLKASASAEAAMSERIADLDSESDTAVTKQTGYNIWRAVFGDSLCMDYISRKLGRTPSLATMPYKDSDAK
jgi:hypothetical protein